MYLSRLYGCPKSSQRDDPSRGISLLGTKSNQRVLNLANTEGGRAQSLFVGPKTAWRLSLVKTMFVIFFDWQGVIHKEFVPEGKTINALYYKDVMERLLNRIRRVRTGMCESGDRFLFARQHPVPQRDNRQAVFGPTKSDCGRQPTVFDRFSTCWLLFISQKWNPTWRGVSLTRFWTSRKPWKLH